MSLQSGKQLTISKCLILEVIKEVEAKWKATIVAITSDASGESRAHQKRLVDEFPCLVAPDVLPHQVRIFIYTTSLSRRLISEVQSSSINLVVGDYYRSNLRHHCSLRYTKKATNLITWLRSKTMGCPMLRTYRRP